MSSPFIIDVDNDAEVLHLARAIWRQSGTAADDPTRGFVRDLKAGLREISQEAS